MIIFIILFALLKMNSDIINIMVDKTVRLNHNSNSSKMSLNGRLDVSPSIETKISDM